MNKLLICGLALLGSVTTLLEVNPNANQRSEETTAKVGPMAPDEFDLSEVVFLKEDQEVDMGYDVQHYLPEGFDPYADPADPMNVGFIDPQDDNVVVEGAEAYLPKDFDPYARVR